MKRPTFTFLSFFAFSLALNFGASGQHRPLLMDKQDMQKLKSSISVPQVPGSTPLPSAPGRTTAGIATQQNLATTVSKPGKEETYTWNDNAWKLLVTSNYIYDSKGNIIEETYTSEVTPLQSRTFYAYNGQNQEIRKTSQARENDTWVNSSQELTTYNAHGDQTEFVAQEFVNNAWVNKSRETYTYDAQHLETEHLSQEWQEGAWVNMERTQSTYNARGQRTSALLQWAEGAQWANVAREVQTYDGLGNLLEDVEEEWDNGTWFRTEGTKTIYVINGSQLTEMTEQEWDMEEEAWVNTDKTLLTYNNGMISEFVEQEWEEEAWVNTGKYIDLVFHDYNNFILKSFVQQKWENNAWSNHLRQTLTFTPGSFLPTTTLVETYSNNAWKNMKRTTITVDDRGILTNYKDQLWGEAGWSTILEYNHIYTFSGIHLVEVVSQQSDLLVQVLRNVTRTVYSNHQTFTVTSVKDPVLAVNTKVYPNPTSRELHVELHEADTRIADVALYNLTGQKVKSFIVPQGFASSLTLDLEMLPKGIYLLRLTTADNRTVSRRVVRQ